jgi:hypothetical protein
MINGIITDYTGPIVFIQIQCLNNVNMSANITENENALKETHPVKNDRKAVPPTESTARGKQKWEHSGADHLKTDRE